MCVPCVKLVWDPPCVLILVVTFTMVYNGKHRWHMTSRAAEPL